MKRLIVVGGSGFVGKYAIRALKIRYSNLPIYVLDLVEPQEKEGIRYVHCDLTREIDFEFCSEYSDEEMIWRAYEEYRA